MVALLATLLVIPVLRPLALRWGLVDLPGDRKTHGAAIPLVGGLAIYFGLTLGFFLCKEGPVPLGRPHVYSFFGASLLLLVVGCIDDFRELSPATRLLAQLLAALIMIFGAGVVLTDLGHLGLGGGVVALGIAGIPFTVFATMGLINAFNMSDGVDGLSGCLALTSLSGLILAAYTWGDPADTALLPILGTAVVGFLLFNLRILGRQRAAIFLGDAGSTLLGFALTWYAISLSQGDDRAFPPAVALWFLLVPILDTVTMLLRRIMRGHSPFLGDREHLHHVFQLAGYSAGDTVMTMTGVASLGVLVGLLCIYFRLPDELVAGAFLLVGGLYFWGMHRAWKNLIFLRYPISRRSWQERRQSTVAYTGVEQRRRLRRGGTGASKALAEPLAEPPQDHPLV